jgi:hypothetical protein
VAVNDILVVEALLSVGTVYGGKGDLYTPDARPALLVTPCTPCTPRWRRSARIATETRPVRNPVRARQ